MSPFYQMESKQDFEDDPLIFECFFHLPVLQVDESYPTGY